MSACAQDPAAPADDRPVTQRIPVLDGVRGLAVLLVMAYHFQLFGTGPVRVAAAYTFLSGFGWAGVDLFFVLSGFLITGILIDSRARADYYRVFYARRTLRIFPLYYVSLALLFWAAPASAWGYVLNWTIGLGGWRAVSLVVSHFWSLCIEEQFYVAWPACVRVFERRGLAWLSVGLIVAAPILRALCHRLNLPLGSYTFTICRTDALALGALLAMAFRDPQIWLRVVRWAPRTGAVTAAGFAAVVVLGGTNSYGTTVMDTIGLTLIDWTFAALLVLALAAPAGARLQRVLSCAPLRFFGKYSYGLYVWHPPVVFTLAGAGFTEAFLLRSVTSRAWAAVLALNVVAFAISVTIALASWHLLEKHFLALKDRIGVAKRLGAHPTTS